MKTLLCLALSTCFIGAGAQDSVRAVNLEKLNTEADENDPFPAPDGNLYYASKKAGRWEIMVAKKSSAGLFGAGKVYESGTDSDCRSPFFFQGALYFAHNKVPDETLKELKNYDLVKKTGSRAPLPLLGVSGKEDELYPWITVSGKEFFFSRKLAEGWTLFVAGGPVPGPIGNAKPVGFPAGYHHATLNASGLLMYLEGPLDDGRNGIFRAKRAKVGAAWSMPEAMSRLNDPKAKQGDMSPSLSADGARLYFASDRPGGKGGLDIWMVMTKEVK